MPVTNRRLDSLSQAMPAFAEAGTAKCCAGMKYWRLGAARALYYWLAGTANPPTHPPTVEDVHVVARGSLQQRILQAAHVDPALDHPGRHVDARYALRLPHVAPELAVDDLELGRGEVAGQGETHAGI